MILDSSSFKKLNSDMIVFIFLDLKIYEVICIKQAKKNPIIGIMKKLQILKGSLVESWNKIESKMETNGPRTTDGNRIKKNESKKMNQNLLYLKFF